MTISEALEIVRGELFGAGTMSRGYMARVDAMKVIQPILEAAGALTTSDKGWLKCRVDWAIPEYTPAIDGMVCPGAAMKGRFNALLSALRGSSNVGIGSQSTDGPGSSPGPRSTALPDAGKE